MVKRPIYRLELIAKIRPLNYNTIVSVSFEENVPASLFFFQASSDKIFSINSRSTFHQSFNLYVWRNQFNLVSHLYFILNKQWEVSPKVMDLFLFSKALGTKELTFIVFAMWVLHRKGGHITIEWRLGVDSILEMRLANTSQSSRTWEVRVSYQNWGSKDRNQEETQLWPCLYQGCQERR